MKSRSKSDIVKSEIDKNNQWQVEFYDCLMIRVFLFSLRKEKIIVTEKSRIMELEKEIVHLKCENLHLQEEKYCIEKIIEAPPPNNEEVNLLKMRCKALEKILRYSDISPMPQIIEEYKSMSTYLCPYRFKRQIFS